MKDQYIKQAVDYAANQGNEWVVLTNGQEWNIYKMKFEKPIDYELVVNFNILDMSVKSKKDIETLAVICKEGWKKAKLDELFSVKEAINKFNVGAILQSAPVLSLIKRELKKMSPNNIKVSDDDVLSLLTNEVIKRDVLDGDMAKQAKKRVSKLANKKQQAVSKVKKSTSSSEALATANINAGVENVA